MAFRMIDSGAFWNDPRVRAADSRARCVLLFLLTGPVRTVLPGLVRIGRAGLAEAFGAPAEEVNAALADLVTSGLLEVDDQVAVMRVVDGPRWDGKPNARIVKAWSALLRDFPPSPLVGRAVAAMRYAALRCPPDVRAALETFASDAEGVDSLSEGYSADGSRAPASSASSSAPTSTSAPAAASASAAPAGEGRAGGSGRKEQEAEREGEEFTEAIARAVCESLGESARTRQRKLYLEYINEVRSPRSGDSFRAWMVAGRSPPCERRAS